MFSWLRWFMLVFEVYAFYTRAGDLTHLAVLDKSYCSMCLSAKRSVTSLTGRW